MKIFSFAILLMLSGCSFSYVIKQGVFQLELLKGAEPIEMALRSKDLDLKKRKKLELIQDIRAFSKAHLSLKAENYQNVNLAWEKALHTVSACQPLSFTPYRWWFPIIGFVPYKGFFDKADAKAEQKNLIKDGFDTQLGRVDGYSTLGFFSDPVWPSMLNLSDSSLTDLIIHELTHEMVYINGQTPFNETLASFVAKVGTKLYTKAHYGEQSPEYQEVLNYHRDHELYQKFFYELYHELEALYGSNKSDEQKTIAKKAILDEARVRYQSLPWGEDFKHLDWSRINNAYLMAFKSYNFDDPVFIELLIQVKYDFGRFFQEISYYAKGPEPFKSLRERVVKLKG